MTEREFQALLELMMCSDPWPASPESRDVLVGMLNMGARARGYADWVEAYLTERAVVPKVPMADAMLPMTDL